MLCAQVLLSGMIAKCVFLLLACLNHVPPACGKPLRTRWRAAWWRMHCMEMRGAWANVWHDW